LPPVVRPFGHRPSHSWNLPPIHRSAPTSMTYGLSAVCTIHPSGETTNEGQPTQYPILLALDSCSFPNSQSWFTPSAVRVTKKPHRPFSHPRRHCQITIFSFWGLPYASRRLSSPVSPLTWSAPRDCRDYLRESSPWNSLVAVW